MRAILPYFALFAVVLAVFAQTPGGGPVPSSGRDVVTNASDATWHHATGESAGADNMAVREDPLTGALDIFARYPAGHVVPTHWHMANERMVVVEGRMQVDTGGKPKMLDPGGFAFMPAREVQKLSCVSKTRCTVYLSWDARYDMHKTVVP